MGLKVVASTSSLPFVHRPSNLWGSRDNGSSSILRSRSSVSLVPRNRSYSTLRRVGSDGSTGGDFSDEEIRAAVAFTASTEAPPEWWGKSGGGRGHEAAMMKKRQRRLEGGFREAAGDEFANCAMKKAFSSMVLGVREVQRRVLQTRREALLREDHLNGEALVRVQSDTNASFVWLFERVFAETPALMVCVMVLLASFTANSAAAVTETIGAESNTSTEGSDVNVIVEEQGSEGSRGGEGEGEEEARVWKSMVEEARGGEETIGRLLSPVTVEMEEDNYVEYLRTELGYQIGLAGDPNNPMLLCNYAQFLFLVARDHDRAEECFKRALDRDAGDAEALSKFADFLWVARKDLWAAEERYQQAAAAAPDNSHITYKYAFFLWNSGAEDTCLISLVPTS